VLKHSSLAFFGRPAASDLFARQALGATRRADNKPEGERDQQSVQTISE
jgi:hypothetical protein